ncbi:hypothetical protein CVS40_9298 [Lucilia cuprina]|nr:hypothetical protein CVS40_9298 [Lucilia cuprina]
MTPPSVNQQELPSANHRARTNWQKNVSVCGPEQPVCSNNTNAAPTRNIPPINFHVPPSFVNRTLHLQGTQSNGQQQPLMFNNQTRPPTFSDQTYQRNQPLNQPNSFHNRFPNHSLDSSKGIEKWGLEFDGTTRTPSVEDFVFRVETLQSYFGVPWTDVLRNMHHFLKKTAHDWLWDFRRMNPNVNDWTIFKKALVSYFHRFESDFDIQRKILERRQLENETFDEFCNAVLHLRNQQTYPIKEQDLVEIMKGNLKQSMIQLLFAVRPVGLDHFRTEARRAENLINNQKAFQTRYVRRQVNELKFESEGTEEVNAIMTKVKLVCWNCKEEGHAFMDCPSERRRLFCYKCGHDNTVTPRCPTCQGNQNSNVPQTGSEARS